MSGLLPEQAFRNCDRAFGRAARCVLPRELKRPSLAISLSVMENQEKSSQPDKNRAAEERPVPSQAEGDLETVEEDLEDKSKKGEAGKK